MAEKTLLIVDDSPSVRQLVKNVVTASGLFSKIFEAEDGMDAVKIFLKNKGDYGITYVMMTKVKGAMLIYAIKESEPGKEAYRNRYKIEHKIADLARYCGMRRCRYRSLTKARIHTLLAATVSNIKRMARLLWQSAESPPQGSLVTC